MNPWEMDLNTSETTEETPPWEMNLQSPEETEAKPWEMQWDQPEPSKTGDFKRGFARTGMGMNLEQAKYAADDTAVYERIAAGENPQDIWKEVKEARPNAPRVPHWISMEPEEAADYAKERKASAMTDIQDAQGHLRTMQENPASAEYEKLAQAETWGEVYDNVSLDAVVTSLAESMGSQALTMPALLLGLAGAGPMAVGQFASALNTERAATQTEVLVSLGIDPMDTEAVMQAMKSPGWKAFMDKKLPKSAVIATFEGLTGFVAGAKIGAGKIANMTGQGSIGATGGVAGEFVGSKVIGEEAGAGEMALEALGSAGGQVIESAVSAFDKEDVIKPDSDANLDTLEKLVKKEAKAQEGPKPRIKPVAREGGKPHYKLILKDLEDPAPVMDSADLLAAQKIQAESELMTVGQYKKSMHELNDQAEQDKLGYKKDPIKLAQIAKIEETATRLSWFGRTNDIDSVQYTEALKAATEALDVNPTSAIDLAKKIILTAPSKPLAAIATRVAETMETLQGIGQEFEVRIIKDKTAREEGWSNGEKGRISFEEGYNLIELRSSSDVGNNGVNFRTMIHELIHAATVTQMMAFKANGRLASNNSQMAANIADLETILDDLRANLNNRLADNQYVPQVVLDWADKKNNSMDNGYEVLAWGLTDPEFQQWMRNTKFSGPRRTFADRLFIALKNLFGIARSDQSTFGRMLGIFEDATNPNSIKELQDSIRKGNFNEQELLAMKEANPPLHAVDIESIRANYEQRMLFTQGLAGVEATNVYAEGLKYLTTLAAEKEITLANIDDEQVLFDTLNSGEAKDLAPSSEPGPYTFLPPKDGVGVLALGIEDANLLNKLKDQYPNYNIIPLAEAEYYVRTGETGISAHKKWRNHSETKQVLDSLGKVGKQLKKGVKEMVDLLPEFDNIDDVQVAKEEMLAHGTDLKQNATDVFASGAQTKATMTNNPMIKWWRTMTRQGIRASQDMNKAMVEPIVANFHKMSKKDRKNTMQALLIGDKNQVDITPAMMNQAGFSPAMKELVEKFYEADRFLFEKNNMNRVKMGMDPVERRAGHFPGIFNDQYQALAYSKGKLIGVVGGTTSLGLNINKGKFKAKYGEVTFSEDIRKPLANNPNESMQIGDFYTNLNKLLGPNDPAIIKASETAKDVHGIIAQQFLGFSKFDKDKKGIEGSIGNKMWKTEDENAKEQFLGMVRYLQDGAWHHEMMPAIKDLSDMVVDPQLKSKAPKTVMYLNAQLVHMTRRNLKDGMTHKWLEPFQVIGTAADTLLDIPLKAVGLPRSVITNGGAKLRETFALAAMSVGNVMFMALQFSQVPIFAMPIAVEFRKVTGTNLIQSRTAPLRAVADTMKIYLMSRGDAKDITKTASYKNLSPEDKVLYEYIMENNLIDFGTLESQHKELDTGGLASRIFDTVDFSRKFPEQTTRPYVFFWYYNILKESGMPQKAAMEKAMNATQFTMIDYHQANRPMVYGALGQIGAQLGQLKTFMHGALSVTSYMAMNPIKHNRALATYLGMYVAFAGVEGLFGFEEGNELVRQFNSVMNDEPDRDLKYYTKEYLPDMLRNGLLTHATGYDVYSRIRVPALISADQLVPANLAWAGKAIGATSEYFADLASVGFDLERASKRKLGNAARSVMPSSVNAAFTDPWARINERGDLVDKRGQVVMDNYDYSTMRKLGAKRPEETETWERFRRRKDTQVRRNDTMKELSTELRTWVSDKRPIQDPVFQEKLREYIAKGGDPKSILGAASLRNIIANRDLNIDLRGTGLGKVTKSNARLQELFEATNR